MTLTEFHWIIWIFLAIAFIALLSLFVFIVRRCRNSAPKTAYLQLETISHSLDDEELKFQDILERQTHVNEFRDLTVGGEEEEVLFKFDLDGEDEREAAAQLEKTIIENDDVLVQQRGGRRPPPQRGRPNGPPPFNSTTQRTEQKSMSSSSSSSSGPSASSSSSSASSSNSLTTPTPAAAASARGFFGSGRNRIKKRDRTNPQENASLISSQHHDVHDELPRHGSVSQQNGVMELTSIKTVPNTEELDNGIDEEDEEDDNDDLEDGEEEEEEHKQMETESEKQTEIAKKGDSPEEKEPHREINSAVRLNGFSEPLTAPLRTVSPGLNTTLSSSSSASTNSSSSGSSEVSSSSPSFTDILVKPDSTPSSSSPSNISNGDANSSSALILDTPATLALSHQPAAQAKLES